MNALALTEGRRTAGVWGPIATAQILQVLMAILRAIGGDGVKVPETSKCLRGFALPILAEAYEADEKSAKAEALLESIKAMAGKKGAKVTITGNG